MIMNLNLFFIFLETPQIPIIVMSLPGWLSMHWEFSSIINKVKPIMFAILTLIIKKSH